MKKICVVICAIALVGLGFFLGSKDIFNHEDLNFEGETDQSIQALSFGVSEIENTNLETDKLTVFLNLHHELLTVHQTLLDRHETIGMLREEIQVTRQNLRELSVRPNREDGVALWHYYNDLLDLKASYEETHGLAYQRLLDLKDSYSVENIDLIIQTFQEVLTVLNERVDILDQGIVILNQSIAIYQKY
ncbi:MAG: hypothetical protein V3569_00400 [Acholeplasmataceae bacterium]|nr:hypothetical protein [Acholeplasmataceae bacterium]